MGRHGAAGRSPKRCQRVDENRARAGHGNVLLVNVIQILQIITARVVIVAASLAVAGVCPAYSQRAAPRAPAGGLFGATRSDVGGRHRLNFTFELAEGFDSAVPPDLTARVSRGLDSGGLSTVLEASSDYHSGRRLQLTGNASTAFKYYLSLDRLDAREPPHFSGRRRSSAKGQLQARASARRIRRRTFISCSRPTGGAAGRSDSGEP